MSERPYPIVCDERGAGPGEETCWGEIELLRQQLDDTRLSLALLYDELEWIATAADDDTCRAIVLDRIAQRARQCLPKVVAREKRLAAEGLDRD